MDKFKPSVVYIGYIEMPCNNFYIKNYIRLYIVENVSAFVFEERHHANTTKILT